MTRKGLLLLVLALASLTGTRQGHAQTQNPYVTLDGTVQGANGLPASNVLLSFTPTQTFYIQGSGVVPPSSGGCGNGTTGQICFFTGTNQSAGDPLFIDHGAAVGSPGLEYNGNGAQFAANNGGNYSFIAATPTGDGLNNSSNFTVSLADPNGNDTSANISLTVAGTGGASGNFTLAMTSDVGDNSGDLTVTTNGTGANSNNITFSTSNTGGDSSSGNIELTAGGGGHIFLTSGPTAVLGLFGGTHVNMESNDIVTPGSGTIPLCVDDNGNVTTTCPASSGGVLSINGNPGAFTFSFSAGAGSCTGTTCTFTGSGAGGGSVTNFIASAGSWPSILVPSVATSTTTPTLSVSLANQSANLVFAGPSSGSAVAPTFRSLVAADLPLATTSLFGAVKPDNTTITISGGVISAVGGGGAVSSVSNSDGTLTVSPTTGAVVASLALSHANTWSGQQTFVAPILGTIASGVGTALTALNGTNISTGTVAAARLPLFGTSASGIVPASGGGTVNFLRADGAWAVPPGSGGGSCPGGSNGNLQYNSSGACGGDTNTNDDGAGNLTAVSYSGSGTRQAALALGVGTGTITATLPTNYAGWIGPATGTPTYFASLPNTNPTTPGIMILSAAATVNGVQQAPITTLPGTTTTVLHGNAAGAPTYAAVSLTADVAGVLPTANGGNNTSSPSFAAQTDAATVTWAIASALIANASLTFTTHGGSRALNLTGLVNGGSYVIWLKQDGTGGEGLTLGTGCTWKVGGGGSGAISLSTGANAIDVLAFTYDGTNCYANFNTNFN